MKLIRYPKLKEKVPLSRSQIWRLERAGKFPKRIQISDNSVGWDEADIEDWLQSRKAA